MKKRLLPIGYDYGFSDIFTGSICILFEFVIILIINKLSITVKSSELLMPAILIIATGMLFINKGLIRMKKIRVLRKERDIMMKKTPVRGKIVDIKRSEVDCRGKFTSKRYANNRDIYQLVVSYVDPSDGKKRTAQSEYYRENLFVCLSDNQVDVYIYGDNGYVIVDGLCVRKFGEKRITIENQDSLSHQWDFYFDIYGRLITAIAAVLTIIIAFTLVVYAIPWFMDVKI